MDDIFGEDDFFDFDDRRSNRVSEEEIRVEEKVYFVPYRWFNEAHGTSLGENEGILYTASSSTCVGSMEIMSNDFDSQIVLNLRREEDNGKNEAAEEGVSGQEYALLSESMWLRALKWHNDSNAAEKDVGSILAAEVYTQDVFPLQIRLSVSWGTNSLLVKISQKDNPIEIYERASTIFRVESELLHIWDFSGQTTLLLMNDRTKSANDYLSRSDEILLELQVYGLTDSMKGRGGKKDDMMVGQTKMEGSFVSGSLKMNGSTGNVDSYFTLSHTKLFGRGYREAGFLGLTGLHNLGNTCFMNSAIQCLVHTPKLVDYFLGDYRKEINYENPLGMNGELALAFGDLLRKLWAPGATPVAPRMFKLKLSSFAPQFSGYNQHDSQEFLAFLLDGLHEDLNRVKCKPYIEAGDPDGRPNEEVADEYWRNHLARNDSIIVNLCQGQFRSMLVCPVCKKVSVTFDPFMYLSLPLPSTTMRTMTVTVLSTDGTTLPYPCTVTVPKCGRLKDLIQALSIACSLRNDERLLVAEIYNNCIIRYLEEPSDSLALIRDGDRLVAYRLSEDSKDCDTSSLVVFMHERVEKHDINGKAELCRKMFGIPLVVRMLECSNGRDIRKQFLKLLDPFFMPTEDSLDDITAGNAANEDTEMEDAISSTVSNGDANSDSETGDELQLGNNFSFYLTDEKGSTKGSNINMNKLELISQLPRRLNVLVHWPDRMIEKYDTCLLSLLPEICKPELFAKRPQESVSLYKCLEAFLKEEPLGPEDMWNCPCCKKHRQASKKLDLWRLPEILVIHLKRFSYSRFWKNKLETFIDFPIDDLDLSTYIAQKNSHLSNHYNLYAICNHDGGMGSGHYTAFVRHGGNQWYEFDDSRVSPIGEDEIKTSAAYVLFYQRIPDTCLT